MNYDKKLEVADAYIQKQCGLGWDDLSDINSLHDCSDVDDIEAACDERLIESGYPVEGADYEFQGDA